MRTPLDEARSQAGRDGGRADRHDSQADTRGDGSPDVRAEIRDDALPDASADLPDAPPEARDAVADGRDAPADAPGDEVITRPRDGGQGGEAGACFQLEPPWSLSLAQGPRELRIADLDGDGRQDLFVYHQDWGRFSVLLGNGNGDFRPPASVTCGASPADFLLADLDGDGTFDLATIREVFVPPSTHANELSVCLGRGDGSFAAPMLAPAGDATHARAADFDGDGLPDLVVWGFTTESPAILLGLGGGRFAPPRTVAASLSFLYGLLPGDFNRDGRTDLATANGALQFLAGQGDGSFAAPIEGPPAESLDRAADIDGDGALDLLAVDGRTLNLYRGRGDGSFAEPLTQELGAAAFLGDVGRINLDEHLDLALVGGLYSGVSFLLGRGDGTFHPQLVYPLGLHPMDTMSLALGDLDDDGRVDVVVPDAYTDRLVIFFNASACPGVDIGRPVCTGSYYYPGDLGCLGPYFCVYSDRRCGAPGPRWIGCVSLDAACGPDDRPVCGCDGHIYPDACTATRAGVDLSQAATCAPPPGTFVCGEYFCSDAEYCRLTLNDVGGEPLFYASCEAFPVACASDRTCACVGSRPMTACCSAAPGDISTCAAPP
jgi:hypothetical protein